MNWTSRRAIIGTTAVLALATGGGVAYAQQSEEPEESPPAQTSPSEEESDAVDGFLDDVAERLGISSERLREAIQTEALERLDEAVAEGDIPEAVADEIREHIEAGELPRFGIGPGGHDGPGFHGGPGGLVGPGILGLGLDTAAEYLDLDRNELLEQLDEQSLAEIATAEGKSVEGLKDALRNAAEERLADAEGLSEEQRAEILARIDEHIDQFVERQWNVEGHFGPNGPEGDEPDDDANGDASL
jgi:hypothetical protein